VVVLLAEIRLSSIKSFSCFFFLCRCSYDVCPELVITPLLPPSPPDDESGTPRKSLPQISPLLVRPSFSPFPVPSSFTASSNPVTLQPPLPFFENKSEKSLELDSNPTDYLQASPSPPRKNRHLFVSPTNYLFSQPFLLFTFCERLFPFPPKIFVETPPLPNDFAPNLHGSLPISTACICPSHCSQSPHPSTQSLSPLPLSFPFLDPLFPLFSPHDCTEVEGFPRNHFKSPSDVSRRPRGAVPAPSSQSSRPALFRL